MAVWWPLSGRYGRLQPFRASSQLAGDAERRNDPPEPAKADRTARGASPNGLTAAAGRSAGRDQDGVSDSTPETRVPDYLVDGEGQTVKWEGWTRGRDRIALRTKIHDQTAMNQNSYSTLIEERFLRCGS